MSNEQLTRKFKISINSKVVIDLTIEGDADLVADFVKQALTGTFGAFDKSKEAFKDVFVNGIKHEIQIIKRDPKGHFVKAKLREGDQ